MDFAEFLQASAGDLARLKRTLTTLGSIDRTEAAEISRRDPATVTKWRAQNADYGATARANLAGIQAALADLRRKVQVCERLLEETQLTIETTDQINARIAELWPARVSEVS
ncbi:MAG: hypothetical protein K0R38_4782 [Polyangiaceae bacterium]|jgi:hypothetical protein|nr:hypothetical protein [Polyangiaceae bacterium]